MYEIRHQKTNHITVLGSRFWDELLLMSISFYLFFAHNGWQPKCKEIIYRVINMDWTYSKEQLRFLIRAIFPHHPYGGKMCGIF